MRFLHGHKYYYTETLFRRAGRHRFEVWSEINRASFPKSRVAIVTVDCSTGEIIEKTMTKNMCHAERVSAEEAVEIILAKIERRYSDL